MPKETRTSRAYLIRFMAGPVLAAMLCVFDPSLASDHLDRKPIIFWSVATALLLSGILIYYLYRTHLYHLFMALADWLGADNYRNFIRKHYKVSDGLLRSTVEADRLFIQVAKKGLSTERHNYNTSTAHLLYQTALISMFFTIASIWTWDVQRLALYLVVGAVSFLTAHRLNDSVEHEDLLFLKEHRAEMLKAAKLLGLERRSARSSDGG